jgi:hypothetical protein
MTEQEMIFALTTMGLVAGTVIVLVRMFLTRFRSSQPSPAVEPLMDRLLRIEQTLDAVAIEVERISEAQRFATKLLAERDADPALLHSRSMHDGR